jgi:large subunit ribosomal protein L4
MAGVQAFTSSGAKSTTKVALDKSVFGVEVVNHELLKSAYITYLANGRENLAKTKTRGEVRGGGKKPWKQKGTGRARFGSSRVPIWRGGGITFGPTGEESYKLKINKKAKRQAIRQSLSLAAKDGKIIIIDEFKPKEGKAKFAAELLAKIGTDRRTLIVVDNKSEETSRATNNLPGVKLASAKYINVYDVLNASHIVIEKKAVDTVKDWLGGEK